MSRSRLVSGLGALAAAALLSLTLSPAASAATTPCDPDHCDFLIVYYSDSTYTHWVGQYEDGPCGQIDYGVHTAFIKRFQENC